MTSANHRIIRYNVDGWEVTLKQKIEYSDGSRAYWGTVKKPNGNKWTDEHPFNYSYYKGKMSWDFPGLVPDHVRTEIRKRVQEHAKNDSHKPTKKYKKYSGGK